MANVFIATKDANVGTDDGRVSIKKGITRVVEGHPLLKAHPEFFRPADEDAHFGQPETTRQEPQVPRTRSGEDGAKAPAKSAPKDEWVAYAQAQGDADAADKTKDELIAEHGKSGKDA